MQTYSIIIPAFNEEASLAQTLEELGKPEGCRNIIVVDDGSTDTTAQLASQAGARVIRHPYNKGYGAAIKSGILGAETDYVVCFDADGQHHREDLLKVVAAMEGYDMVVGRRGRNSHQYWNRGLGKKILHLVANFLVCRSIPDLNSGLRSFRVSTIKKYLHLFPDGFSLSTTSTIAMFRMGHDVNYVPVTARPRTGRRSSVKLFEDGFKTLMLIINLTALFNPMRVFLPLSLLFFVTSIIYFIAYSIFIRVHIAPSMVLLFVTGVLIFTMGIICEQVSAIRRDMRL